jgi:hypothetical protein
VWNPYLICWPVYQKSYTKRLHEKQSPNTNHPFGGGQGCGLPDCMINFPPS